MAGLSKRRQSIFVVSAFLERDSPLKFIAQHFVLFNVLFATTVQAEDWFRWRGPNLDGISIETDWDAQKVSDPESIRWKQNVGTGFGSIVTSENRLFTLGNREGVETLYCLNAETGEVLWQHDYGCPLDARDFEGGPTSTPTVEGSRVYSLSRAGDLFCLDVESGKVAWQKQIVDLTNIRIPGWGFAGSPLVVGENLLLNVGDSGVLLKKVTGDLVWKSADKDCGYGSPVFFDKQKTIAILPSGRSYVGIKVADGTELWRQRWLTTFGCNAADAIVVDGHVFLSSGYNRGSALLKIDGDQVDVVWKNKSMQNQISSSILVGDHVYGVSGDMERGASLVCMRFADGEVAWSDEELKPGAITATEDRLIVITDSGELVVAKIDPSKFTELARGKVLEGRCWSTPVISNGKVFVKNSDGELVAVSVDKSSDAAR